MKAGILCIGTEIVTGLVQERNASFLSHKLVEKGVFPKQITFVPDDPLTIQQTLESLVSDPEISIMIVTGGLGPTEDDITREAVARVAGVNLGFDEDSWRRIVHFYRSIRFKDPPQNNRRQAMIPSGATVLANGRGTAPGFIVKKYDKKIIVLPGVPIEVEYFWETIKEHLPASKDGTYFRTEALKFCGLGESRFAEMVSPFLQNMPSSLHVAYLPRYGEVWFYLYGDTASSVEREEASHRLNTIASTLNDYLFSNIGNTLAEAVGNLFISAGKKIATSESCTGGALGEALTGVPGSSSFFERGYITYSNRSKIEELSVSSLLIEKKGAVSAEVAEQMARNVKSKACTDYGLGITGIAGPTGGSALKPVGLVYLSLVGPEGVFTREFHFPGDRQTVRKLSVHSTLSILFFTLRGNPYIPLGWEKNSDNRKQRGGVFHGYKE